MREIWNRLEAWLEKNAPEVLETLEPGASLGEIKETERYLSIDFPDDARESFRIHNGQSDYDLHGLMLGRELLSLGRMREEWMIWKSVLEEKAASDGKHEAGVWMHWGDARWIPVTSNCAGDNDCIDLNPAPGGVPGQIISVWHEMPQRPLLAVSFRAWFEEYVARLECGKYVYSEEYGITDASSLDE